jgi:hypothetical protein
VVLVLLHGHGSGQGEECARHGDEAVGMHDERRGDSFSKRGSCGIARTRRDCQRRQGT